MVPDTSTPEHPEFGGAGQRASLLLSTRLRFPTIPQGLCPPAQGYGSYPGQNVWGTANPNGVAASFPPISLGFEVESPLGSTSERAICPRCQLQLRGSADPPVG